MPQEISRPIRTLACAAASCVLVCAAPSVTEASAPGRAAGPAPPFMKVADLAKLARAKTLEAVSEQCRQSFPIPVLRSDGLHILFFYYPARAVPQQPSWVFPPNFLVSLDASGRLEELRAIDARELGLSARPGDVIGAYGLPEGMTSEESDGKLARLSELYDVLLTAFHPGAAAPDPGARPAAEEFMSLFALLSEPPLTPCYDVLGRDFFAWVARVAEAPSHQTELHLPVPAAPAARPRIDDDVAIAVEPGQTVERIVEESGSGRYRISFTHLAAIYFLRKDAPKAAEWLALLKRSQTEKRPVDVHYVVGWSQITYVQLAAPSTAPGRAATPGVSRIDTRERATAEIPFPNEIALAGFPRFHEARWARLKPMVATMSDVEAVLGKAKPVSVSDSLEYHYDVGEGLTMVVRYVGEASEIRRGKYPKLLEADGRLRVDLYFKVYDLRFAFREGRPLSVATPFAPPFRLVEHLNAAASPLSMSASASDSDGLSYSMTKVWEDLSSTLPLPTPLPPPTRLMVRSVTYGLSDAVRREYGLP